MQELFCLSNFTRFYKVEEEVVNGHEHQARVSACINQRQTLAEKPRGFVEIKRVESCVALADQRAPSIVALPKFHIDAVDPIEELSGFFELPLVRAQRSG